MSNSPLVLITGGAGFIGSHLSKELIDNGYAVRILDVLSPQIHADIPSNLNWMEDDGIEFIRGSIEDRKALVRALAGVEYIVHLAAETGTGQSMYEIDHYYKVNCQATALLFDILANDANHMVKRIVLASSRSVYGEGAYECRVCDTGRVTPSSRLAESLSNKMWEPACTQCNGELSVLSTLESDDIKPASIYAASKYAQEDLVRISCESLGLGFAILRLQNVYGEGQSLNNPYTGILSIFSTRIRRGLPLPIFEDGNESRDFVHVQDVAAAMLKCINSEVSPDGVFNVGSGTASSVVDVATKLSIALGANPSVEVTGQFRVGDIRHNKADIQRLENILGYSPKVSLEEGMARFALWVLEQPLPEDKLSQTYDELKARNLMG
jgi:dTDP-L-rhamnose 4-epimerase